MKNNKPLLIIGGIILIMVLLSNQGKKISLAGHSSLESCENGRTDDINLGYPCVAPCVEMNSGVRSCMSDCGYGSSNNYYRYYSDDGTCQYKYDSHSGSKCQMDCLYGGVPGYTVCTSSKWRCVDVNTEQQCKSDGSGWNSAQSCLTGESCNSVTGKCESVPQDCADSDGGQNYVTKGTVNYNNNNYVDICVPNEGYAGDWSVKEYYCQNGIKVEEIKDCKEVFGMYDCLDGKCIECTTNNDCVAKYEDGYTCVNNICQLTTNICDDYSNNYGSCSLGGGSVCTADKTAILSGCSDLDSSSNYVYCWTQKTNCQSNKECVMQNLQAICIDKPQCTSNSNCNDGNECTNDMCSNGICTYSNKADGTSCSSGTSICKSGFCSLLECTNGQTQSCTIGSCAGTRTCSNNLWGSCVKIDPNCDSGNGGNGGTADNCNGQCMGFIQECKQTTGGKYTGTDGKQYACKTNSWIWMIGIGLLVLVAIKSMTKSK